MRSADMIGRILEKLLETFKFPAAQLDGQIAPANLPPTGNTGSGYTPEDHGHTATGDGGKLAAPAVSGYVIMEEIAAPSAPAANTARLYAKDTGSGVTELYYKNSDGTERDLSAAGGGFTNPMTTRGDLITGGTAGAAQRKALGASGSFLRSDGLDPVWGSLYALDLPAHTHQSSAQGGTLDAAAIAAGTVATARLGSGSASSSTYLRGDQTWATPAGFANPMTTAGDLIYGGASGAPTRLAIGATNRVLTVISGNPSWESPAAAPAELGYVEITSDLTSTNTSMADATGLSLTVTVGSRPILVEFYSPELRHGTADRRAIVEIYDNTAGARIQLGIVTSPASTGVGNALYMVARVNPASGSRTYKIRWQVDTSGTITMRAASTNPSFLRVVEIAT